MSSIWLCADFSPRLVFALCVWAVSVGVAALPDPSYVSLFTTKCTYVFVWGTLHVWWNLLSKLILKYSNSLRGVILRIVLRCWSVTLSCGHWTMWLHFQEIAYTVIRNTIRIQEWSHQVRPSQAWTLFLSIATIKVKHETKHIFFAGNLFKYGTFMQMLILNLLTCWKNKTWNINRAITFFFFNPKHTQHLKTSYYLALS